jgi:uncharacterized repeat protein (TIGR03843 family)
MSDEAHEITPAEGGPGDHQSASIDRILALLRKGRMKVLGEMPNSSNYTFAATIRQPELECLAIYKPQRGERPLWDFRRGTLCLREYATFLVAMSLGWIIVPPTVLRRGPHGLGAVQLFVDTVPGANFFTLRDEHAPVFQRMCAFDYIVNNADRKGGHCLLASDGRIWGIDHGITFHTEYKLRTVIWDWASEPLPPDIVADIDELQATLAKPSDLTTALNHLLDAVEMQALRQRVDTLLTARRFPDPLPNFPNVPWPLL